MWVSRAGEASGRTVLWSGCWLHCSSSCSQCLNAEHVTCPPEVWPSEAECWSELWLWWGRGGWSRKPTCGSGGPSACSTHRTQWSFSPPAPGIAETRGCPTLERDGSTPGQVERQQQVREWGGQCHHVTTLWFPGAWLSSLNISGPFLQSDEVLTVIKAKAQWPAWQPLNV